MILRDGVDKLNPDTGKMERVGGDLFDPNVFNSSVKLFMQKRKELANYFDESQKQDIFDYIPQQTTNLIFTPKKVVKNMVDLLEQNDPGCFDDPNHTFADLYMKSGLFLAEIVKRLFNNSEMRKAYPDDKERIKHIFKRQIYGLAPNDIILNICKNYILGFNETMLTVNTENNIRRFDLIKILNTKDKGKEIDIQSELDKIFGGTNP